MPDAWIDFRGTFSAWLEQICSLCLGHEGCDTPAVIGDSSTLHAFVKKNLEQAWSKSAGPSKASLSTLCCEVLAERMDVGPSIGALYSPQRETSDHEQLGLVPRRFTYMIMPFVLIRSLYCLLADQNKVHGPSLLAHASPLVLDDLLRHSAYCEASFYVRMWMERVFDRRRNFSTVIIKAKSSSPSVQHFVRKQLVQHLSKDGNALNWLHPQVLPFFEDNPFQANEANVVQHTKTLVTGVLKSLEKPHKSDALFRSMNYEALAKELTSRIRRVWIQSKRSGLFGQVRLQHYLLKLINCLSEPAMEQHSPLAVVVVEMSILLMISLTIKADTQAADLIPSTGCEVCLKRGENAKEHYGLVSLIHKLFASNDKITLQSIADSPTSSPLSVLCTEGLDPGSAFFLVTKLMHWHHLALAEAQALAVCSSWVSSNSTAPCPDRFVRRLAKMQTEAERCALQSNKTKHIYDDVMDAWIAQGPRDPDPDPQSTEVAPSFVQHPCPQTTHARRRHSEPMHNNRRRTLQASTSTNDDDENDELDLLKDTSNIQSARVCRKVKRLDVGLEARKYRKTYSSTRRKSLDLVSLDSMPVT